MLFASKQVSSNRKTTKCRVTDMDVPVFGCPKVYLFSHSIGIIIIKNREIIKHISIDNQIDLLYHNIYEKDKTTFVRYEPVVILYEGVKINL